MRHRRFEDRRSRLAGHGPLALIVVGGNTLCSYSRSRVDYQLARATVIGRSLFDRLRATLNNVEARVPLVLLPTCFPASPFGRAQGAPSLSKGAARRLAPFLGGAVISQLAAALLATRGRPT